MVSFGASTVLQLKAFERGNDMKKGYWVVAYRTVGDEAMMSRYLALARAALGPLGGAFSGAAGECG